MDQTILDFYTQHSSFTDPGEFAPQFDRLPDDLPTLVQVVQGLIIPPYHYALRLHNLRLEDIKDAAFGIRKMESFVAKLLSICDAPLAEARPPNLRLGVNCRNFATLLVAIMRQKGIPARERVGFEGYFGGKINYEHRIAEYWRASQGRWVRVDAMVDPLLLETFEQKIDILDIATGAPFYTSADVWLNSRRGEIDPDQFGDSETDIGLPPIRYALLHDFDALNKLEVCGNDAWSELIEKPDCDLTDGEWHFLDEVACLTADPDARFDELSALHRNSDYGRGMRRAAIGQGIAV